MLEANKKKRKKTSQAAKHSLHQLRKRRHIGPKCHESPSPPKLVWQTCMSIRGHPHSHLQQTISLFLHSQVAAFIFHKPARTWAQHPRSDSMILTWVIHTVILAKSTLLRQLFDTWSSSSIPDRCHICNLLWITQVRVWRVARSQSDILRTMRWITGIEQDADLIAYYKFDEPGPCVVCKAVSV